jgi:hypothetical protein
MNHYIIAIAEAAKQATDNALSGANDIHVVLGPIVWRPSDGTSKHWYFIIATSEADRGFRCDQVGGNDRETVKEVRAGVLVELIQHRPLVIHDTDDELYMARLCEGLWPGKRIAKIRQQLEAERAAA